MKNWNVLVQCLAEGKAGVQDNWWGVAANEVNAVAAAIKDKAKKWNVGEDKVAMLSVREVMSR